MSDVAIEVDGLCKAYRLGLRARQQDTLVGAIAAWVRSPLVNFRDVRNLSRLDGPGLDDRGIVWALKDVSFQLRHGEAVGVIGRNGAGKSTLLKILSRITEPTSGTARVYGRVASLLEVGTGFHPDLTGRENIYLNGTILGMRKREIDAKFDEIVDFSGIEPFIDTPAKRYSTGMRVRLAFSVAAHLEPEILIIDEVLAVGDAEFQKKCLGKMEDVTSRGRAVIFVSHNMGAITRLCSRAISLHAGRVSHIGLPHQVVQAYLDGSVTASPAAAIEGARLGPLTLDRVSFRQNDRSTGVCIDNLQPFDIEIEYSVHEPVTQLLLGFDIIDAEGNTLFRTYDQEAIGLGTRGPGAYRSRCAVPGGLLQPSVYHVNLLVGLHRGPWLSRNAMAVRLDMTGPSTTDIDYPGMIRPFVRWTVEPVTRPGAVPASGRP